MIPVNKLMIVDDDELSNYITGKIVEHSGLAEKADSFYSAKAALKYLKTNSSMRQGDYPDLNSARLALQGFPETMQPRAKLWIRRFEMVQRLLE